MPSLINNSVWIPLNRQSTQLSPEVLQVSIGDFSGWIAESLFLIITQARTLFGNFIFNNKK